MIKEFQKAPSAVLDYTIDWTDWLDSGDGVATLTWAVPSGLTEPFTATSDGAKATVWIGGGTLNQIYRITNHIVTTDGRSDYRSIALRITAVLRA